MPQLNLFPVTNKAKPTGTTMETLQQTIINHAQGKFFSVTLSNSEKYHGRIGVSGLPSTITDKGKPYLLLWQVRERKWKAIDFHKIAKINSEHFKTHY